MEKIIIFVFLLASACANLAPVFLPGGNKLPDGVVGHNYSAKIEITNAVLFKENIGIDISPVESGLKWNPQVISSKRRGEEKEEEDYHHILISGKPKVTGEILIHVNGYSMGVSSPGRKIDKTYIIKIKDGGGVLKVHPF